jgi:adenosine deaminase
VGVWIRFRRWADRCAGETLQIEFLAAFGRDRPPEQAEEIADRVPMLFQAGLIVGVALAGPECGHSAKPFHKTFARFREAGIGIEIHAGDLNFSRSYSVQV